MKMILTNNEMIWNSVWLILLAIASLMVMVNKLDEGSKCNNLIDKTLYGGLTLVALCGLFWPITCGLIGINIMVTIILVAEYLRYDKSNKKNKW